MWRPVLALILVVAACGPAAGLGVRAGERRANLNGRLVVHFDGELDPLWVTERSVVVQGETGRALPAVRRVEGETLVLLLVLDRELLARPPRRVTARLAGLPSIHALAGRDGRRLSGGTELVFELQSGLEDPGNGPPELVAINGRSVRAGDTITFEDELHLVLDGVVDPDSVAPLACPLVPVVDGMALTPVHPRVDWRLAGRRFELWLRPAAGGPRQLELHTRRLGLRGLSGRPVGPSPLVVTLMRG